jgi:hypothetical protein
MILLLSLSLEQWRDDKNALIGVGEGKNALIGVGEGKTSFVHFNISIW